MSPPSTLHYQGNMRVRGWTGKGDIPTCSGRVLGKGALSVPSVKVLL